MSLARKRLTELFGLVMIGDSVATIANPKRHIGLWKSGPSSWQKLMEQFRRHPQATRLVGLVGLGTSLWMVSRQRP